MLSKIPEDFKKMKGEVLDRELLRLGIVSELDAINLYEQLASWANDPFIKKVFLDIAKEEKTHVGEFQTVLLENDKEQVDEIENAKEEIKKLKE